MTPPRPAIGLPLLALTLHTLVVLADYRGDPLGAVVRALLLWGGATLISLVALGRVIATWHRHGWTANRLLLLATILVPIASARLLLTVLDRPRSLVATAPWLVWGGSLLIGGGLAWLWRHGDPPAPAP